MITRKTLELAALAAGNTIYDWRPHLDDGDAARLAVQLGLTIEIGSRIVVAFPFDVAHDGTETDKLRAWRHAIVLCAAAVGERMKGGKTARQAEHACCGALASGPHKMGCDYKMR